MNQWKRDTRKGLFATFWNPHSPQCIAAAAEATSAADRQHAADAEEEAANEGAGADEDNVGEDAEAEVAEELEGAEVEDDLEDDDDGGGEAEATECAGTTDTTASAPSVSSKKMRRPRGTTGGRTGRFAWKPKYIKERVAPAFFASGGTLDYQGLQGVINEVFDVVDGEGCPTWKARAVHKLLLKGAVWG